MVQIIAAVALQLFFWSYTALLFLLLFPTYLFAALLRLPGRENLVHRYGCFWARSVLEIVPGWGYEIEGLDHATGANRGPYVMVANHQSAMDIFALMATGLQFRWLSKDTVFKLPFIGQAMTWAGYVGVKRGDKESQKRALDESAARLMGGVSMMFFPEGTRSRTGELQPFKTGAFRLAERVGVPILPIAIEGASRMMRKNSLIPYRARIRVRIFPPMQRQEDESMADFIERVRTLIRLHIENLRINEGLPSRILQTELPSI